MPIQTPSRDVTDTGPAISTLTSRDTLGILIGFLLTLLVTYVLSRGRVFWEDEMLGWMLLRDPSFHHMVTAWRLGADGGGFSFYLTGRAWFALFGASDLAFRLYTSTCFGLAFAATWLAARRFYTLGAVAFALFNTWFFSPSLLMHMTEGRFYGLEVLSAALVVWLTLALARSSAPSAPSYSVPAARASISRTTPIACAALFLGHGLLTTSHLLGFVYSFALLLALVVADRLHGRLRPGLYLSGAAAWLLLLPERSAILASAQVGKPHFWTTQPRPRQFLGAFTGFSEEIAFVLFVLVIAAAASLWRSPSGWKPRLAAAVGARGPVYVVIVALFAVPLALFAEGLVGTPLMTERYLQPVIIAVALLTLELLRLIDLPSALTASPGTRRLARYAFGAAFAVVLLFTVFRHFRDISFSAPNYTDALHAKLPQGIPVVCEDAYTFTEMLGRHHDAGVPYLFLLDWTQSLAPTAPRVEVTHFHLMQNWQRVGYFSGSITDSDSFLAQTDRFFVIHVHSKLHPNDPPPIGNPIAARLAADPAYQVRPVTTLDVDAIHNDNVQYQVSEVCRGHCTT